MHFKRLINTVDAHTEGEPVRLVVGGMTNIPGKTMAEKKEFFAQNLDHLRSALCDEPRGHEAMVVLVMTPPVTEEAAFGVLFMLTPKQYPDMCIHCSIGVATIAVEMGIVEPKTPVTKVIFNTPAGTIHARVSVDDGKAKSVTIENVPSFLYTAARIKVPGLGEIPVDIAYGGNFFGIIDAKDIGIRAQAEDIFRANDLLIQITRSINQQLEVRHPELDFIEGVHLLILNDKPLNPRANVRSIECRGRIMDRSPCGTGTSAKMAALHAKGELNLGETYITESVIGSLFYGKLIKEAKVGNFRAVTPEVTGRAFITGMHNFVLDEDDPFQYGFRL